MPRAIYITHPEVRIDPAVPVPQWSLSGQGRARMTALAATGFARTLSRIVSSAETKATETAAILGQAAGLGVDVRSAMHENDRSATGFLLPPEFEAMADAFFAQPDASVRGWERAKDAQARIISEVRQVMDAAGHGETVAICGHGAVGTLLWCHLAGVPISRVHDQARGGNFFVFAWPPQHAPLPWQPIEQLGPDVFSR